MHRIFIVIICLWSLLANAQTVGLISHQPGAGSGYTLFSKGGNTYLLDTGGQVVHSWFHGTNSMHPGYLQPNGDLVVVSRGIKRYDWSGTLLWEYINPGAHHDVEVMPNGHVLLLIRGFKSNAEVIAAGRDPALLDDFLEPMVVYEINTSGNVVWEWHVWDHLIQDFDPGQDNYGVVADHPELVDINFMRGTGADWLHANAIDYHPELDQILLSPRFNNEIWIIDHSTTTLEAAGHTGGLSGRGGDLLYRWGNPVAYGAGTAENQQNFGAHDAQWIELGLPGEGNIMIFNNGGFNYGRDGNYSTIDEITPPLDGHNYLMNANGRFGPETLTWQYQAPVPEDFYSSFISGAHRLPSGNTFIDEGEDGHLFEVTAAGEVLWRYQNPVTNAGIVSQGEPTPEAPDAALFRSYRYPVNHPAFADKTLMPMGAVESYADHITLTLNSNQPGSVRYPQVAAQMLGSGQLIPLQAQTNGEFLFSEWMVVSGNAQINNLFSNHAELVAGDTDSVIEAVFVNNPDWIFGQDFE